MRIVVCGVDDLEEESATRVEPEGRPAVAVYNVNGEFYATDDLCTHGDGWLSEGEVIDDEIYCPLHGGAFIICTGKASQGPCQVPVRTHKVIVESGEVILILEDEE